MISSGEVVNKNKEDKIEFDGEERCSFCSVVDMLNLNSEHMEHTIDYSVKL